jgi:hypothetical protein
MEGALPAALLAEPLLLVTNDHQCHLRVCLIDLVPAVVLTELAEVGSAPIDGACLQDAAAAASHMGPPRCPDRSRRSRAPDQAEGEILELYLGGGGGEGGWPGVGTVEQHTVVCGCSRVARAVDLDGVVVLWQAGVARVRDKSLFFCRTQPANER